MLAIVNLDGSLVPPRDASISVFDRGLLAGDLVYEVLRTYGLHPFAVEAHLARLARSAERVGLALPWDAARTGREIVRTAEASRGGDPEDPDCAPWNRGERSLRVVMTGGADPRGPSGAGPRAIVIADALRAPPAAAYQEGVRCLLVRPRAHRPDPSAKTGRHLAEVAATREALAAGAHEAILLDGRGFATEGASSNLFRVRAGRLETPPLEAGILDGITRGLVLRLAREAGIPAAEVALAAADLEESDELFLTSTSREVLPVTRLGERAVGAGVPGPLTRRLHDLFRALATREAGPR